MSSKHKDLIVYIDRNSLTFYGGLFDKPTKVSMDEKIFSDLEIVDKKLFIQTIEQYVKKTEDAINLIIVFSDDSAFFKELPIDSTKEQLSKEETEFLSLMPFDKTAHKLIKFTKSYKLIGINLDIKTTIADVLRPFGYKSSMTIPAIIVSNFDQKLGLTESVAAQIIANQDKLKAYNLTEVTMEENKILINQVTTQKKNYLPILVGVFLALFCLLTVLLLKR